MNQRHYINPAIILLLCTYAIIIIYTAWLCDDAFITFRTIDNFINGYGLRWNIDERVQTYTHPLWMFCLAAISFFTNEIFYTATGFSILISILAVIIATIALQQPSKKLLVLILFISSRAFIDYSTSGLENPLTHLLLGVFFCFFLGPFKSTNILFASVLCSLGMLSRIDTGILLLPPLAYMAWQQPHRLKTFCMLLAGFTPLIAWELFSLFYYGFLFPNTAYAKLYTTAFPPYALCQQGGIYLLHSLKNDPSTILVIISAIIAGSLQPCRRSRVAVIGICLYLIYIVRIGGCHMAGRFLSAPFYISALILTCCLDSYKKKLTAVSIALICVLLSMQSNYSNAEMINKISNQRTWYQMHTGLLKNIRHNALQSHELVKMGLLVREHAEKNGPCIALDHRMGLFPYFAGPNVHVVDYVGLTDPLIARLPTNHHIREKSWRPGHLRRYIPIGYIETLETGIPQIEDQNLNRYYQKLKYIISGDLFSFERLKTALLFNLGCYDFLIDTTYWQSPPETKLILGETDTGTGRDVGRKQLQRYTPYYSGLRILLGSIAHSSTIDISLTCNDYHQIDFLCGSKTVYRTGYFPLPSMAHEVNKLSVYRISLPQKICEQGYDSIHISSFDDGHYGFGTVVLVD